MVLGLFGDDHEIDQHARNFHQAWIEGAAVGNPFDLGDDDAARVVRGHGDGLRFQRQRLLLHGDVAVEVGCGAADERDMDRESLVEEIVLAVDGHQADDVFGGLRIQLAAAQAWIDESAETDVRQRTGFAGGDVAEQMGDDALRQIPGLDLVLDGQRLQFWREAPMAADDPGDQSFVAQMVEAARLAVALAGGIDQSQSSWCAGLHEALFERDGKVFRKTDADKTSGGDGVTVLDSGNGVPGGNDLWAHGRIMPRVSRLKTRPESPHRY